MRRSTDRRRSARRGSNPTAGLSPPGWSRARSTGTWLGPGEETEEPMVTSAGHVEPGGKGPRLALGAPRRGGGDDVQDEGSPGRGHRLLAVRRPAHRGARRREARRRPTRWHAPRHARRTGRCGPSEASARRVRRAGSRASRVHRLRQQLGAARGHQQPLDAVGDDVGHAAHRWWPPPATRRSSPP